MTERGPDHDHSSAGVPGWVRGFAIAGVVLVLLIVIMLLTGHGPGRHLHALSQSQSTSQTVQVSATVPDRP